MTEDITAEASKRSCAYIMRVRSPMQTLEKISELLAKKGLEVDMVHLQVLESGDARLIIHCAVEKDKIAFIGRHFEEMSGVKAVDWMNARTRIKQY